SGRCRRARSCSLRLQQILNGDADDLGDEIQDRLLAGLELLLAHRAEPTSPLALGGADDDVLAARKDKRELFAGSHRAGDLERRGRDLRIDDLLVVKSSVDQRALAEV